MDRREVLRWISAGTVAGGCIAVLTTQSADPALGSGKTRIHKRSCRR